MQNVVPGILQRLRPADIIRMAGLAAASLGQEYSRTGSVLSAQRQDACLSGIVDLPHTRNIPTDASETDVFFPMETDTHSFTVSVELQSSTSWVNTCSCHANSALLCAHGAALLYKWLAHPMAFATMASDADPASNPTPKKIVPENAADEAPIQAPLKEPSLPAAPGAHLPHAVPPVGSASLTSQRLSTPAGDLPATLSQLGLSELRGIAREYALTTHGLTRQQLSDAILQVLQQPEAVHKVATTLEKPQRQLLAALTLAGGSMTDDDLRGLFERFSLGQPQQLQRILLALQNKAMLFRTSLNSSSSTYTSLSTTLLDVGWFVPIEVRTALRVSVPVTIFNVELPDEKQRLPLLQLSEPFNLPAELLLVARALDGFRLAPTEEWLKPAKLHPHADAAFYVRPPVQAASDGSVAIPPPIDMPSPALLSFLQTSVPRSPAFLNFAVRLLRLADLLHKDDSGSPYLRMLPNTVRLLLGPSCHEALRDLFELWLTQSSYGELFALQEDGLRLRCRTTSLNLPVLRSGELDAENNEARQLVITLLAQAPPEQWISFSAFSRFIYRLNPLFLQRRQRLFSAPHWWIEQDEGRPLKPLQLSDWSRAEIYYLSRLLHGPLHWWGACDLALASDGRLQAFRLTPLAAWLLHRVPWHSTSTQHYYTLADSLQLIDIKIQDSEDVLVTCSLHAWPIIDVLETFTEPAGVWDNRLRYRLTPQALGSALGRGHHPTHLLELLRHLAAAGKPQADSLSHMLAQLEQWIASYGRVRIYTGVTLLETTDIVVMRELSATTSLDEQIVQTLQPTMHILKKAATERIIDDLKRRGQSPLLHDEEFYGPE